MRILFVSSETPLFPAGGIATYLEYMIPALQALGHEVFLFSFRDRKDFGKQIPFAGLQNDRIHIEWLTDDRVHSRFHSRSHDQSVSFYLADQIERCIDEWEIDVVEATDWQAPCLGLFYRLQSRAGAERRLFSVYNHGLSEFVWEADQLGTPDWARSDFLTERQQMRACDLVVVPSNYCKGRLKMLGVQSNTSLVREPYVFRTPPTTTVSVRDEIQYMGRISIGKGADKIIYAANVLHSVRKLRRIELIGRVTFTTFREKDILKYIRARLHPELRDRLSFIDFRPRDAVLDLLEPGALSPHLGSHETFSYACIESIDAGQVPIVRHDTPMVEFFPEEMHEYILDAQMRSVAALQKKFEKIIADAPRIVGAVQEYCRANLDPETVAGTLGDTYAEALDRKRGWRAHAVPRAQAGIGDITVLIPAYKPNHEFMETVDSLADQSAGMPRVLICDDGTPETHQPWFEYAQARLPECQIVRQPNSGLLAARNTLAAACETPLSIFLDTDDMFSPTLLENALGAYNGATTRPNAVIPQRRNFGESTELVLRYALGDYAHMLENDFRMTALIETAILTEIGFDATRRNGEGDDWVFWLDFHARGYKAIPLPEPGFLYRFHTGSMSWPWSEGQTIGTQSMIRDVVTEMCSKDPHMAVALARSQFAKNTAK
ncbi:glycosyltransferase [Lacimonas salitolerans]|uniref:Glycosyltransferase n=1 Tax=Lacimonas salitolerans TaxID=1323750 RepID=A0ABW4EJ76_9RHOB